MTHDAAPPGSSDRRERARSLCDEIKNRTDYRSFYREFCPAARVSGGRLHSRCPIPGHNHSGKGHPSFSVDLARGLFHCFSRDEGGDIVRFWELMHGVSFSRAVDELAARLNLPATSTRRARLSLALRAAPDADTDAPDSAPDHELTSRACAELLRLCEREDQREGHYYLLRRGISPETIERTRIRYFPRGAYARIARALKDRFTIDELRRSGLFNRPGHLTFYLHRLLFPFLDGDGRAIYLQARTISPKVEPRWHNLRGSVPALYNSVALADAPAGSVVYLVEGFTDTLTLLSHNFRAVGIVGAGGLRDEWLDRFEVFRVICLLDPDEAGRRAAERYAGSFARRGIASVQVELPSDVNDFFRNRASAPLELTLLTEAALDSCRA